jgi:hypothetical protein
MTDQVRTPSLHIFMVNGQLWAEGPSKNGVRRKFQVQALSDLVVDIQDQAIAESQRQAALASERHSTVFSSTAAVHGLSFAARTIGGKIPRKSDRFFVVPTVSPAQAQAPSPTTKRQAKKAPTAADLWIDTRITIDDLE